LIHGYFSDSSVWNEWDDLLERDGIPYSKVNFGYYPGSYYDQCGLATSHGNDVSKSNEINPNNIFLVSTFVL
jgi:hypothetical protein